MEKHPGSREMLLAVIAAQGLLILFHCEEALAMTAPSTGSFAYDVYDDRLLFKARSCFSTEVLHTHQHTCV